MPAGRPTKYEEIVRCSVEAPSLPADGYLAVVAGGDCERFDWLPETLQWWADLWTADVAQLWGPESAGQLAELARLVDKMHRGALTKTAAARRQIEDRLLLSPKALRQAGIVFVDDDEQEGDKDSARGKRRHRVRAYDANANDRVPASRSRGLRVVNE